MQTRRLPELIETLGDDALSLAEGTAGGVDAAGTAIWGLTKGAAVWAAERVLRQALAPVHEYRTSSKRVQAALDAQLAALPTGKGKEASASVEEGVQHAGWMSHPGPALYLSIFAGHIKMTMSESSGSQQTVGAQRVCCACVCCVRCQQCGRLRECCCGCFCLMPVSLHPCPSRERWNKAKPRQTRCCW